MIIIDDYQYEPTTFIVASIATMKKLKKISYRGKLLYKKIKRLFPYNGKITSEESEVIPIEDTIFKFSNSFYELENEKFKEVILGKPVAQKELPCEEGVNYKIYVITFYDVVTQFCITKYLVIPKS